MIMIPCSMYQVLCDIDLKITDPSCTYQLTRRFEEKKVQYQLVCFSLKLKVVVTETRSHPVYMPIAYCLIH